MIILFFSPAFPVLPLTLFVPSLLFKKNYDLSYALKASALSYAGLVVALYGIQLFFPPEGVFEPLPKITIYKFSKLLENYLTFSCVLYMTGKSWKLKRKGSDSGESNKSWTGIVVSCC
jgi:hypothetical protein